MEDCATLERTVTFLRERIDALEARLKAGELELEKILRYARADLAHAERELMLEQQRHARRAVAAAHRATYCVFTLS